MKNGKTYSTQDYLKFAMQATVSLVLLIACLIIIFKNPGDESLKKWASGTLGLIIGYWLK